MIAAQLTLFYYQIFSLFKYIFLDHPLMIVFKYHDSQRDLWNQIGEVDGKTACNIERQKSLKGKGLQKYYIKSISHFHIQASNNIHVTVKQI